MRLVGRVHLVRLEHALALRAAGVRDDSTQPPLIASGADEIAPHLAVEAELAHLLRDFQRQEEFPSG